MKKYDYSQAGAYFITICSQNRRSVFGYISSENMVLNDAGDMIEKWWTRIPEKFEWTEIDDHITMPNHFHGIIVIVGAAQCGRPEMKQTGHPHWVRKTIGHPHWVRKTIGYPHWVRKTIGYPLWARNTIGHPHWGAPTVGDVVGWFKTMTTNEYLAGIRQRGWPRFSERLWQRNYYERVIRNEKEMLETREYIIHNPLRWEDDEDYVK